MKNINSSNEKAEMKKRRESAFSNRQILKFNLLIANVLIFY